MKEINGLILTESNEAYHSNKAISFSNLKLFIQSVELFKMHLDGLLENKVKEHFKIGNYVHSDILENDANLKYALVSDDYNGATKAGKAYKAEQEAKGLELLNKACSKTALACVKSLRSRPDIMKLLKQGYAEVSWRVIGPRGLTLQCRTDWICDSAPSGLEEFGIREGESYIIDLKTARNEQDFLHSSQYKNVLVNEMFYAGQEAFYLPIINNIRQSAGNKPIDHWLWVITGKDEPYNSIVVRTPEHVKIWARNRIWGDDGFFNGLSERMESGDWIDQSTRGLIEPEINITNY